MNKQKQKIPFSEQKSWCKKFLEKDVREYFNINVENVIHPVQIGNSK